MSAPGLDHSKLTNLVGYVASRAAIVLRRDFERALGPLGLKVLDYSLLVLVASNPEVNQKQLGEALDISAPNMAITLDRLVERGWVERVRSTQDRRAMIIHLTPAGSALAARAQKIAATMEEKTLAVLSPAERALLIELLGKVGLRAGRPRSG
ncbi:MarR family winged helix-turn-helix transcriptional regulator [Piscinibacter sp.]|uniref:MarR family winged helix-turn-helix transcriptional regulator n=1 Tax=Piscinibacter sp. TaxID=1903157 RepID=UPI0039E51DC4